MADRPHEVDNLDPIQARPRQESSPCSYGKNRPLRTSRSAASTRDGARQPRAHRCRLRFYAERLPSSADDRAAVETTQGRTARSHSRNAHRAPKRNSCRNELHPAVPPAGAIWPRPALVCSAHQSDLRAMQGSGSRILRQRPEKSAAF